MTARCVSGCTFSGFPKIAPTVGRKRSATIIDAVITKIIVNGRKLMNLPGTPGQNSIGENAASVVAVDDTTGQNIRRAPSAKASRFENPSVIFRSAYSTTMMLLSTRRPTVITMPKRIIMLIVKPPNHKQRNPIKNEAGNGLKNETGTLAMARTSVIDSASSQFFINVKNNDFLDHKNDSAQGFGYAVFGKVISGMDVVRKIEHVRTATRGGHKDVPVEAITIESTTIVEG